MSSYQYSSNTQSITKNGETYVQECKKVKINGKEHNVCKRYKIDKYNNADKYSNVRCLDDINKIKPKYKLLKK